MIKENYYCYALLLWTDFRPGIASAGFGRLSWKSVLEKHYMGYSFQG
jgi:hypothetical protein